MIIDKVPVLANLNVEIHEKLCEAAKLQDVSVSELINDIIIDYFLDHGIHVMQK